MAGMAGELIGRGRHADVFAIDGGTRVLRRYRAPFTPRGRDTVRQAEAMRAARQAGFPAPEVYDAGGTDLVMERIDGHSMITAIVRRPWTIAAHARLLADLHDRLHRIDAPADFPAPVGEGTTLLHLDLQPENVLITADGAPVVLDWEWAARGPALADVAHTALQLGTSEVPGGRFRRIAGDAFRAAFAKPFLARYDATALDASLPTVAAYRLATRDLTDLERQRIKRRAPEPSPADPAA